MLPSIDVNIRGKSDVRNTEVQARECSTVLENLNHWDITVMYSMCSGWQNFGSESFTWTQDQRKVHYGLTQSNSASSSHN